MEREKRVRKETWDHPGHLDLRAKREVEVQSDSPVQQVKKENRETLAPLDREAHWECLDYLGCLG